ncbi:MAG: hypothetical protein KKE64_02940, partial [Candidatus Omnitrophica bacterium]|nr:hypothetical protein [Candidatus Omnitrophota bacterium]
IQDKNKDGSVATFGDKWDQGLMQLALKTDRNGNTIVGTSLSQSALDGLSSRQAKENPIISSADFKKHYADGNIKGDNSFSFDERGIINDISAGSRILVAPGKYFYTNHYTQTGAESKEVWKVMIGNTNKENKVISFNLGRDTATDYKVGGSGKTIEGKMGAAIGGSQDYSYINDKWIYNPLSMGRQVILSSIQIKEGDNQGLARKAVDNLIGKLSGSRLAGMDAKDIALVIEDLGQGKEGSSILKGNIKEGSDLANAVLSVGKALGKEKEINLNDALVIGIQYDQPELAKLSYGLSGSDKKLRVFGKYDVGVKDEGTAYIKEGEAFGWANFIGGERVKDDGTKVESSAQPKPSKTIEATATLNRFGTSDNAKITDRNAEKGVDMFLVEASVDSSKAVKLMGISEDLFNLRSYKIGEGGAAFNAGDGLRDYKDGTITRGDKGQILVSGTFSNPFGLIKPVVEATNGMTFEDRAGGVHQRSGYSSLYYGDSVLFRGTVANGQQQYSLAYASGDKGIPKPVLGENIISSDKFVSYTVSIGDSGVTEDFRMAYKDKGGSLDNQGNLYRSFENKNKSKMLDFFAIAQGGDNPKGTGPEVVKSMQPFLADARNKGVSSILFKIDPTGKTVKLPNAEHNVVIANVEKTTDMISNPLAGVSYSANNLPNVATYATVAGGAGEVWDRAQKNLEVKKDHAVVKQGTALSHQGELLITSRTASGGLSGIFQGAIYNDGAGKTYLFDGTGFADENRVNGQQVTGIGRYKLLNEKDRDLGADVKQYQFLGVEGISFASQRFTAQGKDSLAQKVLGARVTHEYKSYVLSTSDYMKKVGNDYILPEGKNAVVGEVKVISRGDKDSIDRAGIFRGIERYAKVERGEFDNYVVSLEGDLQNKGRLSTSFFMAKADSAKQQGIFDISPLSLKEKESYFKDFIVKPATLRRGKDAEKQAPASGSKASRDITNAKVGSLTQDTVLITDGDIKLGANDIFSAGTISTDYRNARLTIAENQRVTGTRTSEFYSRDGVLEQNELVEYIPAMTSGKNIRRGANVLKFDSSGTSFVQRSQERNVKTTGIERTITPFEGKEFRPGVASVLKNPDTKVIGITKEGHFVVERAGGSKNVMGTGGITRLGYNTKYEDLDGDVSTNREYLYEKVADAGKTVGRHGGSIGLNVLAGLIRIAPAGREVVDVDSDGSPVFSDKPAYDKKELAHSLRQFSRDWAEGRVGSDFERFYKTNDLDIAIAAGIGVLDIAMGVGVVSIGRKLTTGTVKYLAERSVAEQIKVGKEIAQDVIADLGKRRVEQVAAKEIAEGVLSDLGAGLAKKETANILATKTVGEAGKQIIKQEVKQVAAKEIASAGAGVVKEGIIKSTVASVKQKLEDVGARTLGKILGSEAGSSEIIGGLARTAARHPLAASSLLAGAINTGIYGVKPGEMTVSGTVDSFIKGASVPISLYLVAKTPFARRGQIAKYLAGWGAEVGGAAIEAAIPLHERIDGWSGVSGILFEPGRLILGGLDRTLDKFGINIGQYWGENSLSLHLAEISDTEMYKFKQMMHNASDNTLVRDGLGFTATLLVSGTRQFANAYSGAYLYSNAGNSYEAAAGLGNFIIGIKDQVVNMWNTQDSGQAGSNVSKWIQAGDYMGGLAGAIIGSRKFASKTTGVNSNYVTICNKAVGNVMQGVVSRVPNTIIGFAAFEGGISAIDSIKKADFMGGLQQVITGGGKGSDSVREMVNNSIGFALISPALSRGFNLAKKQYSKLIAHHLIPRTNIIQINH